MLTLLIFIVAVNGLLTSIRYYDKFNVSMYRSLNRIHNMEMLDIAQCFKKKKMYTTWLAQIDDQDKNLSVLSAVSLRIEWLLFRWIFYAFVCFLYCDTNGWVPKNNGGKTPKQCWISWRTSWIAQIHLWNPAPHVKDLRSVPSGGDGKGLNWEKKKKIIKTNSMKPLHEKCLF